MVHFTKFFDRKIRGILVFLLLTSFLLPVTSEAKIQFIDTPSWAEESIDYLVENGAIQGYSDDTFRPYAPLTRAQAVKILAVSLALPIDENEQASFIDTKDHWASHYIAALQREKEGIFTGYADGSFRPNEPITRAQLAKIIVETYQLERNKETLIHFSDLPDWAATYILTLGSLGIVEGPVPGKFKPSDSITRVQMAAMVHRTEVDSTRLEVPKQGEIPSIQNVTVFNETKFEVLFQSQVDEDIATEIEQSGKRFVVYKNGDAVHSEDAIQSQIINFDKDYKKASIILARDTVEADAVYTVALLDGDYKHVADVLTSYTPVLLKKGMEQPEILIDGKQEKLVLKFHEKMAESAQEAENYYVYKNQQLTGTLRDYIEASSEKGKWVDATEKTAVEFLLDEQAESKKFSLGDVYKIVVSPQVDTYKGRVLSEVERTIRVKVPNLTEAQPKVKFARVVNGEIVLTFDHNISEGMFRPQLIVVNKPNGHTIPMTAIEFANESNTLSRKEMKLVADENHTIDNELTYTIDLPANVVKNPVFPNAVNEKTTAIIAKGQKDLEVMHMSAELIRQSSHKEKADLFMTFDQRVDLDQFINAPTGNIHIADGGTLYQFVSGNSVELYEEDLTGKTIKIKDVTATFKVNGVQDEQGFTPREGQNYRVAVQRNTVKTENGRSLNQEQLEAVFTGVSIAPPEFDKIILASADEIMVHFKEEIDARNLRAHHLTVQGYEQYHNGKFTKEPISLTGNTQIQYTVQGKVLTIKPAHSSVKFVTHAVDNLLTIQGDVLTGMKSGVENKYMDDIQLPMIIDRANPVMIGGMREEIDSTVTVTYSEPVTFSGENVALQASQFSVENAVKNAYGSQVSLLEPLGSYSRHVMVTLNKTGVFPPDLDVERVKLLYTKNNRGVVKDEKGNEQSTQVIYLSRGM